MLDTPPPPTRRPRHAVRYVGVLVLTFICVLLGAFMLAFTSGKQVSNVFSNVSNGLGGGGGLEAIAPANNGAQAVVDQPVAPTPAPQDASQPGTSGSPSLTLGTAPAQLERALSVSYTVPAGKMADSFKQVTNLADSMGGYLESSTTSTDEAGNLSSATLVLRVPEKSLSDFLNHKPSEFQEGTLDFSSTDHTAEYKDANKRLEITTQKRDALQQALRAAVTASDISTITEELSQAQADVESLTGSINQITEQVNLSKVTVSLGQRGVVPTPPASRFATALQSGWDNDIAVLSTLLLAVLTILPVAIVLGLAWLVLRPLLRKAALRRVASVPMLPTPPQT